VPVRTEQHAPLAEVQLRLDAGDRVRSDNPSDACSTITDATTSPGTNRGPRPEENRSVNHLVGEQPVAMVRQERFHAGLPDQLTAQRLIVEQLPIGFTATLHQLILVDDNRQWEEPQTSPLFNSLLVSCPADKARKS
jgi:hypothetical protein